MKIFLLLTICFTSSYCFAFEINPSSHYQSDKHLFSNGTLSNPVHENLTLQAITETTSILGVEEFKKDFIVSVINGARWNDDPLSLLSHHKKDFLVHFLDACKDSRSTEIDVTWDLFYRSHCGDMQFLHSMASTGTETAEITTEYIKTWLEYMYKVANGTIPYNYRFRSADHHMSKPGASSFKKIMISKNGGREKWTPILMFSMTCDRDFNFNFWTRPTKLKCEYNKLSKSNVMDMALGSLLHLIQDSYTKSHALRTANGIEQYGLYKKQSSRKHKKADKKYDIIEGAPELIKITGDIIAMVLKDRKNCTNSWDIFNEIINKQLFYLPNKTIRPGSIGYN